MKNVNFEDLINKSFQNADVTRKRETIKNKASRLWLKSFSEKYGGKARVSDFVRGVLIIAAADSATQQEIIQFDKERIFTEFNNEIKQIKSIKIVLETTHDGR